MASVEVIMQMLRGTWQAGGQTGKVCVPPKTPVMGLGELAWFLPMNSIV
jgi:hypothetical protein